MYFKLQIIQGYLQCHYYLDYSENSRKLNKGWCRDSSTVTGKKEKEKEEEVKDH